MLDTTFRILQANVNRSAQATETVLDIGIRERIAIIAIQEPWFLKENDNWTRPLCHNGYITITPQVDKTIRPRTTTYINQNLLGEIQVNPVQTNDRDIQNLILQDKRGNKLQILNVYNERDEEGQYTVERTLL